MMVFPGMLREDHHRVLREVADRGTSNAAAGLSEMVGRKITIRTPDVLVLSFADVQKLLGEPEDTVVGVYLAVSGEVEGHILLLLSPADAKGLVDMVMDLPQGTTTALGALERSALGEVGNLTGSFFLNALADLTRLGSHPSPPAVMVDMGAAVLDVPLTALARSCDEALVMNTVFSDDQRQIQAFFLVMPDLPSLKAILEVMESRWQSS